MRCRAGLSAFSLLSTLVAGCGDQQPRTGDGGSGAGMSMSVLVRRQEIPCRTAPAAPSLQDAAGAGWWMEGARWCHAADGTRPAEAWGAARGPGTSRLVMQGRTIALLEPEVNLRPVTAAPAPVPFVACGRDARSRVFAAENRLRDARDLGCGRTYAGPGFTLTAVGFAGPTGMMPAVVTTPDQPSAGSIVYLFGGPYENLPAGLVTRATTNHLLATWGRRAALVIPAYLGIDRIRSGAGDATRARAEVEALVTRLERHGPVCVIGFSLGGPIAAAAVAGHPDTEFLLAAPLATTPARFVARALAAGRTVRPITLVPTASGGGPTTLPSDKAYLDYFAGSDDRDITALIGRGPHPNLRIAYAAGDLPVRSGDLAAVAPMLKPGAVRELPAAVGHSIEAPFAATSYRPLIDAFLSDCLYRR